MSVSRLPGLGSGQGRLSLLAARCGRGRDRRREGGWACVAGLVGPASFADVVNGSAVGDGVVAGVPGHMQHK
jgi:hypothetical protein